VLSVIAPTAPQQAAGVTVASATSAEVSVSDKAQSWSYPVVVDTTHSSASGHSTTTHIPYGSIMTLMMTQVPVALSHKYTTTSKVSCVTDTLQYSQ
jgi:hypothetical protein